MNSKLLTWAADNGMEDVESYTFDKRHEFIERIVSQWVLYRCVYFNTGTVC